jgi:hypothetical protein
MQTFHSFEELYTAGGGSPLSVFNFSPGYNASTMRRDDEILQDTEVYPARKTDLFGFDYSETDVFNLGYSYGPVILDNFAIENGVVDWVKGLFGRGKKDTPKKKLPDTEVTSSYLDVVGYDPDSSRLVVRFQDGAVIEYFGVPEGIYNDLLRADSHGQYFYYNIRDDYPWRILTKRFAPRSILW